jgi:hypothetical protein
MISRRRPMTNSHAPVGQLSPVSRSFVPRRYAHLLILGLLCCLPVLTAFSSTPVQLSAVLIHALSTANAAEESQPSDSPLSASDGPVAVAAAPPAAVATPAPAVRPATPWVQAFRATTLWASERPDAPSQAQLPQWTIFRQLGTHVGTRLPVEYPGDGLGQLPLRGWVETGDIGPSRAPNPEFELAFGGNVSPTSGVVVPRRMVQAWPQGISAEFAVLVDGDSGEILWGRNAHGEVAPASLTKIATSLVAIDRARLTDRVNVQVDSRTMYDSTVMGLTPGQNLTMETLLFGLMLPSGNDAALAIAQHVAGSEAAFANLMNARVAQLGLVHSHFVNAHGLDAPGHYSSPFDLATLARAGMRDPTFARLASARRYEAEGYSLVNLNRLLGTYPKADGVKIGYTDAAGRAIVGSATENGHRVYVVLIRTWNPTAEAQALLEWAFRGFSWP